ncbi:MAG: phosphoglycerate kinase [Candidatus Latescibacterota bacterium]|nr:phosphoglycerate kinase [Candidatus Latescibacterota bacterium]
MAKVNLRDVNIGGKRVLVRVDFNVPLDGNQQVSDDTRILAAIPTIEFLLSHGAAVVLMSHLGRPKGQRIAEMSLAPVACRLTELLGKPVCMAADCIGEEVSSQVRKLEPGQIILLENLRFYKEEESNDEEFSRALADLGEVYVNDAFGAAHRAHASTEGVTHYLSPSLCGLLMEAEITYLQDALQNPARPFVAILGGAKISGKIEVIDNLLDKVDTLIIGGGMSYTFFKSMGLEIGNSLLEEDRLDVARKVIDRCQEQGVDLLLPTDIIVADGFSDSAQTSVVPREDMPIGWEGVDIGPETRKLYSKRVAKAGTVIWNGPVGVFEIPAFAHGTRAVGEALSSATKQGATSIIGGGDTAAAIVQMNYADAMTHISTGGGASLECMGGRILPGVAALTDKEV